MAGRVLGPMLSRLVDAARAECFQHDDQVVGSEYLLLGLLSMTPGERLEAAGIDCAAVGERAEQMLATHRNPDMILMGPRGCQTPRVKRVLEAAAERAASERRVVCLRDLWCALLSDRDSAAVQLLKGLELDVSELQQVLG
jgi:ATP-dependent Clp protease ATP-binding subunit ClpA